MAPVRATLVQATLTWTHPIRATLIRAGLLAATLAPTLPASLVTASAHADDTLAPLVVTAPRERTGEAVLADHVGTHSRVDADKLTRRDITLDDVLGQEAGVQSRRVGGFGSFASITVRAASPAQTSLLLDGVRLDSAGTPVVDLSTLELLTLEGIDVYRGVTPLQFGAGGIGGAVNLVTPRVDPGRPLTRLGAGVASFGTARAEFAHRARHGRWDSVAALGALSSENDYPFLDGNGTPLNAADDRRVHRNNAAVRRIGALAKIGTAHDENARSDLLLQFGDRRLGVPEWRNARDNDARFDTGTAQLQFTHVRDGVGDWDGAHTLYLHAEDSRFDDRDSEIGLGAQDTLTRARTVGFDTYWTRPLAAGSFDTKLSFRHETLASRDRLEPARDLDARRDLLTLVAGGTLYALDGRLVIAPTLRGHLGDDDLARSGSRFAATSASRHSNTLTPGIGVRLDASEALVLRASLERHVREPSFAELFVDRGVTTGNPDLVAERGLNADLGIDWTGGDRTGGGRSGSGTGGGTLDASATLFASERDELIVTTFDSRGVGRALNIGEARILGVELSAAWTPNPTWRLAGNATYQDAVNRSANPVLDGRQLPGEARVQLQATLRYRLSPRWQLRLDTQRTRGRFYDQSNKRRARDSTITDLGIDYTHGPWRAAFAVQNLDDRNVEDFNGFPRPGRAFSLNVTFTL